MARVFLQAPNCKGILERISCCSTNMSYSQPRVVKQDKITYNFLKLDSCEVNAVWVNGRQHRFFSRKHYLGKQHAPKHSYCKYCIRYKSGTQCNALSAWSYSKLMHPPWELQVKCSCLPVRCKLSAMRSVFSPLLVYPFHRAVSTENTVDNWWNPHLKIGQNLLQRPTEQGQSIYVKLTAYFFP